MDMKLFLQIVLLMVIYSFIKNFVKCLHNNFCPKCKK